MTHRPTIDTLEAKRALEEAGFDPKSAEALMRLIDDAVRNSAASRTEFIELKLHIERSERRIAVYLGIILALTGTMFGITINFEKVLSFLSGL